MAYILNPLLLRENEEQKSDLVCKDCGHRAIALWCDNDGNNPLCNACVAARKKDYQIKYAKPILWP
jgi:hypothetical protein